MWLRVQCAQLDDDGDGFLDYREFEEGLGEFNVEISGKDVDELFVTLDKGKDGETDGRVKSTELVGVLFAKAAPGGPPKKKAGPPRTSPPKKGPPKKGPPKTGPGAPRKGGPPKRGPPGKPAAKAAPPARRGPPRGPPKVKGPPPRRGPGPPRR